MRESKASIFHEIGFDIKGERLPEAVVYSLARTFNLVSRKLAKVYERFGLTAASFNLLMLLKHGKDRKSFTQQEIGLRLVVSPSNMTGLVDRLEKKGLAVRVDGKDRRSKLLEITPKGSQILDDVWPLHLETIEQLTRDLDNRETQIVLSALLQLRQTAEK